MSNIIEQGTWGVCGFVSVLQYLHENGLAKEFGTTLTRDEIQKRLGAEIVTYLKIAKVEKPSIIKSILDFTASFGVQYKYDNVDVLISKIEVIIRSNERNTEDIIKSGNIGIGMEIDVALDYMHAIGLKSEVKESCFSVLTESELSKHKSCIVGIGYGKKDDRYNGLKHWVYVNKDGSLWNWGKISQLDPSSDMKPNQLGKFEYISYVVGIS